MDGFSPDILSKAQGASCQVAGSADEPRRTRLRFTDFQFTRTPSGRCDATVQFEWTPGEAITGRAEGVSSPMGDLRTTADAALRAIEAFSQGVARLELIGVKTMRAFDAHVVMVSVLARSSEGERRLLGCHLSDDDLLRGTVIATLQATNRVLGNAIATR